VWGITGGVEGTRADGKSRPSEGYALMARSYALTRVTGRCARRENDLDRISAVSGATRCSGATCAASGRGTGPRDGGEGGDAEVHLTNQFSAYYTGSRLLGKKGRGALRYSLRGDTCQTPSGRAERRIALL